MGRLCRCWCPVKPDVPLPCPLGGGDRVGDRRTGEENSPYPDVSSLSTPKPARALGQVLPRCCRAGGRRESRRDRPEPECRSGAVNTASLWLLNLWVRCGLSWAMPCVYPTPAWPIPLQRAFDGLLSLLACSQRGTCRLVVVVVAEPSWLVEEAKTTHTSQGLPLCLCSLPAGTGSASHTPALELGV